MMHNQDIIITICSDDKKPIREHDFQKMGDNSKKCKVFLPFDSEYKIMVKNNNNCRLKLKIEIDGTVVSGPDLITSANCTEYIERFVNENRKFKFVKKDNEAVSDPSNVENGIIKIRAVKEIFDCSTLLSKPDVQEVHHHHHHHHHDGWDLNRHPVWPNPSPFWYTTSTGQPSLIRSSTSDVKSIQTCYSMNCSTSIRGEAGATVSGSISNQVFNSTHWNGDNGMEQIFTFHLLGLVQQDQKEWEEYQKLKKKFEG